jgi:small subunit ribosomal protein S2
MIKNREKEMKRKLKFISPFIILGFLAGIRLISHYRDRSPRSASPQRLQTSPSSESKPTDDLTQIEGIGPKSASALHKAGIHTYKQLADSAPEQLRGILKESNMRMINPETWPEQASLAAKGEWNGLYALQDKLKGGRWV